MRSVLVLLAAFVAALAFASASFGRSPTTYRIDHVTAGDTVVLGTAGRCASSRSTPPAVYFGVEGYGWQASATTKRLLPPGARVWLLPEPATDRVDQYGRLLRYVIRTRNAGFTACRAPSPQAAAL